MGKFLSPEEQMRLLNERAAKNAKMKSEKADKPEKSFKELATKSDKKKKKAQRIEDPSVQIYNPFEDLFSQLKVKDNVSSEDNHNINNEYIDNEPNNNFHDPIIDSIQPVEDVTQPREIFVTIMDELKRIVIDDGIAPKPYYFTIDSIDRDNNLENMDIDEPEDLFIKWLKEYMISLSYPTALYNIRDLEKYADVFTNHVPSDECRLYYYTNELGEEYVAAYYIDTESFDQLDKLIEDICDESNSVELDKLKIYSAIISACGTENTVFLMTDEEQLNDFYMSSFNSKEEFIEELKHNDSPAYQSKFVKKINIEGVGIINATELDILHTKTRNFLVAAFNDNGLDFEYVEEDEQEIDYSKIMHDTWDADEEEANDEDNVNITITDSTEEQALVSDDMVMVDTTETTSVDITIGEEPDDVKGIDKVQPSDESLTIDVVRRNR